MSMRKLAACTFLMLAAINGVSAAEVTRRLVCAGPLCAQLNLLRGGGMGAQLTTFPGTHVNMRCDNGRQQDSRTSTYMYCRTRAVSLQHCKKGVFKSTCSPWFIFTMHGAEYNPQ